MLSLNSSNNTRCCSLVLVHFKNKTFAKLFNFYTIILLCIILYYLLFIIYYSPTAIIDILYDYYLHNIYVLHYYYYLFITFTVNYYSLLKCFTKTIGS